MDYDEILNRTAADLPVAKTLPDGTYILKARNAAFVEPKGEGNAKVLFFYTVAEAGEDVDQTALDALGDDYDLTTNEVTKTFWVERINDWQPVTRMLDTLETDPNHTILDRLKESKGRSIRAYLTTRNFTDKEGTPRQENDIREYGQI